MYLGSYVSFISVCPSRNSGVTVDKKRVVIYPIDKVFVNLIIEFFNSRFIMASPGLRSASQQEHDALNS